MLISATLEGTVTRGTFVSSPSREQQSFGTTTCLMGKVRACGQVLGFSEGASVFLLPPWRLFLSAPQIGFCHNQWF